MATSFRRGLANQIISLLESYVGIGTDPNYFVKTFDVFLHDVDIDNYPFVVVSINQVEQIAPGEMGTLHEINAYETVIYYLDIAAHGESYYDGEQRRDFICHKMQYLLEENPRLGNYRLDLETHQDISEYVYDSNFTNFVYDSSGQEEFYTFVSELHLSVDTAKN